MKASPSLAHWKILLLLAFLCLVSYWPSFDNGFISDDYVFLDRVETWAQDFFYLFEIPPENFRATTYLVFWGLKRTFGYHPEFFYAFTMLVHLLNTLLLWRLTRVLTGRSDVGALAAVLFATFQSPQEAVMWLGGMHELWLGFAALATVLLWAQDRFVASALVYLGALFCKESAPVILLLVPLVDFWRFRRLSFRREYTWFLLPTFLFAILFLSTAQANSLIAGEFYAVGFHGIPVLLKSLHRLFFPWVYFLVALQATANLSSLAREPDRTPGALLGVPVLWMVVTLLPYIFLTYQGHVPSRHTYLASAGMSWFVALGLSRLNRPQLTRGFLMVFVTVNIWYLWIVKDRQFEERAAPTARLVEQLRVLPPGPLLVLDFPENPWIAKLTTRLVAGWQPEMVKVNASPDSCPECRRLQWDRKARRYDTTDN